MQVSIIVRYVIGAIIALICQAVLSTNIQVGGAVPNFMLCYVIACSLANSRNTGAILPFIIGLVYDLMTGGPVGAMALVCVVVAILTSTAYNLVENTSIPMIIVFCIVSCVMAEIFYGGLVIACDGSVGLLEGLVGVSLPSALYDILISLLAYVLCVRFVFRDKEQIEMTIIDSGAE